MSGVEGMMVRCGYGYGYGRGYEPAGWCGHECGRTGSHLRLYHDWVIVMENGR